MPDDLSFQYYEIADRTQAIAAGGMGLIQRMVKSLQLDKAINRNVNLFKIYLPYSESDHVMNIAYNVLAGGTCLGTRFGDTASLRGHGLGTRFGTRFGGHGLGTQGDTVWGHSTFTWDTVWGTQHLYADTVWGRGLGTQHLYGDTVWGGTRFGDTAPLRGHASSRPH